MKKYVLLEDNTVGVLFEGNPEVGSSVTVAIHDENGIDVFVTGTIKEIYDSNI